MSTVTQSSAKEGCTSKQIQILCREYALLNCGLVVGPVIEKENEIFIIANQNRMDLIVDSSILKWNNRGICQFGTSKFDIQERFQLVRGDGDGGGLKTLINMDTEATSNVSAPHNI